MRRAAVVVGLIAVAGCMQSTSEVESTTTVESTPTESDSTGAEELRDDVNALLIQTVQLELRMDELEAELENHASTSQSPGSWSELDEVRSSVDALAGQIAGLRSCVNGFMDVVAARTESVAITYPYC